MQPAVWTGFFAELPLEEALRRLHRLGCRCVEVATEHLRQLREEGSPQRVASVKGLLEELGISAPQAHAHLSANFAHDDPARRADDLEAALAELPICAGLGVKTVVLHPGFSAEAGRRISLERTVDALREITKQAAGLGLRVAVENMIDKPGPPAERRLGTTIEDLWDIIEAVGSPHLGICLDTGHAHAQGLDLAQAVRAAVPRLWALHVSDNDGARDLHLHPFYGNIDWAPFREALREVGFDGPFNLEVGGFARVASLTVREAKCRHALELAALMTQGGTASF